MLNILLAEDNLGDVFLVRQALQQHHVAHELHVVRDGDEALNFMAHMGEPGQAPCPDLVLLDLNLPKIDGPEVLTEFRKHPLCSRTPVVVITSSDAERDRKRMNSLGIARYFRKPSELDEFMELGSVVRELTEPSSVAE
jgi:CheY-like chemotaxis protein